MMRPDDELTPLERDALTRLPRSADLPPDLEQATVAALAARGLLRQRRRWRHPALAMAASLLLFIGGLAVGRFGAAPGAEMPDDNRPRFALFLYEGPEYRQPAPDAMEQRVQEYVAWASAGRKDGSVEGGEKLKEDDDVVIAPDGSVGSVPAPADASRLAGYFLIRATDERAALAIARSCPHVRYGGRIVIREIDRT